MTTTMRIFERILSITTILVMGCTTCNAFVLSSSSSSTRNTKILSSSSSKRNIAYINNNNNINNRNLIQSAKATSIFPLYLSSNNNNNNNNKILEPLIIKGDWSAYLDEERTGLIYYFNSITGESLWEPPIGQDFPPILLTPLMKAKAQVKQEEYINIIKEQQKQKVQLTQKVQSTTNNNNNEKKKNFFTSLLSDVLDDDKSDQSTTKTDSSSSGIESSSSSSKRGNGWFSSVAEDVIKEQNAIVEPIIEKTPTKKKRTVDESSMDNKVNGLNMFKDVISNGMNIMSTIITSDDTTSTTTTTTSSSTDIASSSTSSSYTESVIIKEEQIETIPTVQLPTIEIASLVVPHPAKVRWGGEDAIFIKGRTFGIFDGVSGAKKKEGITLYSKMLANEMSKQLNGLMSSTSMSTSSSNYNIGNNNGIDGSSMTIQQISNSLLQAAEIADEKATGASTAIIGSINNDGYLRVLNVGDSSCIVIRKNKIISRTREISHYFECPYQLSIDSPDRPRDGTKLNIELQKGDIIFMASDGIFDNLYDEKIVEIITSSLYETVPTTSFSKTLSIAASSLLSSSFLSSSSSSSTTTQITSSNNNNNKITRAMLQSITKKVCDQARKVSLSKNSDTPYSKLAKRYNDPVYKNGLGGKLDDISCILVRYD